MSLSFDLLFSYEIMHDDYINNFQIFKMRHTVGTEKHVASWVVRRLSGCWLGNVICLAYKRLVGKTSTIGLLVGEQMSVGNKMLVGKEYVGRESFCNDVKLLVGNTKSVGNDLCRPDLW
jgi:hypothetical protein